MERPGTKEAKISQKELHSIAQKKMWLGLWSRIFEAERANIQAVTYFVMSHRRKYLHDIGLYENIRIVDAREGIVCGFYGSFPINAEKISKLAEIC